MSNSENEPLTQEQIERTAAELIIPKAEARRMLSKKKLRE